MADVNTPSAITLDMLRAWAKHYNISLEDGSQYPGCIGSLVELENGQGEWPEWLTEEEHGNLFAPLAAARKAALDAQASAGAAA